MRTSGRSKEGKGRGLDGGGRRAAGRPRAVLSAALAVLALTVAVSLGIGANAAEGDEIVGGPESLAPTAAQTRELLESGTATPLVEESETDLQAAQSMPHRDLARGEALELVEAVFEPELEGAGGFYDEFEPERFLSNYAAVVPVSSLPEVSGQSGESLATEHPNTPVLVESTLPLRTENASGKPQAVSLELENSEGELQPENPLAEVGIPDHLGEGISLAAPEINLTIVGAPEERVPTNAGGEFAFYPEIARDTDLIAAPTAQGLETMADIRSVEAPMQTTYDLDLPSGAELRATKEGGAEVVDGDRTTLLIPPPSALDAAGNPVQTELTVSTEGITVTALPTLSTAFPVLVDPSFIQEGWRWTLNHESLAAWTGNSTNYKAMGPFERERWNPEWYPGLDLSSGLGDNAGSGTQANWEYWVPRYREDMAVYHEAPTTYVHQMWAEGVLFLPWGNSANYPALVIGLVDPGKGWNVSGVHYGGQGEMDNWNNKFTYTNELEPGNPTSEQVNDKGADMNLVTYENEVPSKLRDTYMADAYVSVVDTDAPEIEELNSPAHWSNTTPEPIPYTFEDRGLGVRSAGISFNGTSQPGWGFDLLCSATTASPCPRVARSTETHVPLAYYPASLPTGKDWLTVTVGDVMWGLGVAGHTASANVLVKVDHTAPEVSVSGPLTEQGSLGAGRPAYALRVNARDGSSQAPQSGIKKVEVLVDGKKVAMPEEAEWEPNCQTENCPFNGEWTMNASEYAAGAHEVKVIATDAAGNVSPPKILHIELHPTPPSLSVSGSLTEQASLGSELPSYKLAINSSTPTQSPYAATIPSWSSSFGGSGTGNGQFNRPGAMAVDAQGNLWVVDSNGNRLEKFTEGGVWVSQIKPETSSKCALSRPTAVAINAAGDLWVTDSGHKRVVELSPAGACLGEFGGAGTTEGKFAGSGPEALAIDYHGNIWVADTYGGRLEKFNENGVYVRSVATKGEGPGQLRQPDGIAIAPGGNVFVTDWEDDKVVEYGQGGKYIRQFGSMGSGPGQLQHPAGITVDSRGDVWVPDQNDGRVEEFDQGGEYLGSFGAKGSESSQFELTYPTGIVTDANGDLWVTNAGRNQVEKWVSPNYVSSVTPTYLSSFGTVGTTVGHFTTPQGLAVDASGHVWVDDLTTDLVQRWTGSGLQPVAYGGKGKGKGLFEMPAQLTVNSGHVWIADCANDRIQELNENGGGFINMFGENGSQNGPYFNLPTAVAVDSAHHLWVADAGNNRVEELSETGSFIRSVSSLGAGGALNWPSGVAVGPGNKIWVSDYGNHRVVELSETGAFLREMGENPSEPGGLSQPIGLAVDSHENVWVADRALNRVVEFNSKGESVGEFGSSGSGPGAFNSPQDVAFFGNDLYVTDVENHRVQEWSIPPTHSQVLTEITIDGKRAEGFQKSCVTETCSSTNEWTLQSSSLTPGTHEVVVRATDGLGNTTSTTFSIKVGDTTKPSLELGGELPGAPGGWIQQEGGNYSFTATATDAGFGVTSLVFTIDGNPIASKTQACSAGGCGAAISAAVNAKNLAAGAHTAKVVATDGAGNVSTKEWTINVDPEGAISTEELKATAEASEETSGSSVVAQTDEIPGIEGSTAGVGLTESAEEPGALRATGTYLPVEIGAAPEEGFEIYADGLSELAVPCDEVEAPEGEAPEEVEPCVPRADLEAAAAKEEEEIALGLKRPGMIPITVTPAATGNSAEEIELVGGQSAVSANAGGEEADTVIRPLSDGGLSFAQIRGPEAAEHYAYELNLSPELHLRQPDPQHIEVFYWEYGITAFVITAEPAHDAIGTAVPTHLSVSGPAEITLTVEHRGQSPAGGGFVYPVMGGTGWQGGYRSISFEMNEPLPPAEGEEEEEELEEEGVSVNSTGKFTSVEIMGFGPEHFTTFSNDDGDNTPTPKAGWAQYIGRQCDYESEEYGTQTPGKGSGAGAPDAGPAERRLDEAIYHCHAHPDDQGGVTRSGFAVSVNGTYSWEYGTEARIRTKPVCRVAGHSPPAEAGCGGPVGEVRAGNDNPKVFAYNRVWFSKGTYVGTIPFCAVLEVVLPSKPKLQGKHALESREYLHWHTQEQGLHDTAANCQWEHF